MGFKNFYINIIFKLLFITLNIAIIIYFLFVQIDYIITFFGLLSLLFLIISLFRFIDKTNRDFTNFLTSFIHNDLTINYSNHSRGKTIDHLYKTFKIIQDQFRRISFERELMNQHLQNLVEHLDVGIISVDKDWKIQLINDAFKKILNRPYLSRGQNISEINKEFCEIIKETKPNEKRLINLKLHHSKQPFAIHTNQYKLGLHEFKLISIKDIHGELDANEMESYNKLIRVLTHEIMNTLSPIISLSGTINQSIKELVKEQNAIDPEAGNYLNEGIEAIQSRSEGLLKFTESYRKLLRIPQPKIKTIKTHEYFKKFNFLFKENIKCLQAEFSIKISDMVSHLSVDAELFEQVLINIYKNAFESFNQDEKKKAGIPDQNATPIIQTEVYQDADGLTVIKITDNGCGLDTKSSEQAFIPFYTTKEEGTGIGLSLSKQIVLLHGGSIILESEVSKGTTILIRLRS